MVGEERRRCNSCRSVHAVPALLYGELGSMGTGGSDACELILPYRGVS